MNKIKLGIIGSNGFIGNRLCDLYNKYFDVSRFNRNPLPNEYYFDLNNVNIINYDIFEKIDYVIFTSALSKIEYCEDNESEAKKINVENTILTIKNIINKNCKVVFLSSDAVYGNIDGKLDEDSQCNPISVYGNCKLAVEEYFRNYSNMVHIVRLPYIFSCEDSFTRYLLQCAKNGSEAEVYDSFYRNVISIEDLADIIRVFIDNWDKTYIINAAGDRLISRMDIAIAVADNIKENTLKIIMKKAPEKFWINRPKSTEMVSKYLIDIFPNIYSQCFESKVNKELKMKEVDIK